MWRDYDPERAEEAHCGEPGSGSLSDAESDGPLEPPAIVYNNMLSLAEAARLREDGSFDCLDDAGVPSSSGAVGGGAGAGTKRGRRDSLLLRAAPQQRGSHAGFKDPIELGWCSAAQGERLFNVYAGAILQS